LRDCPRLRRDQIPQRVGGVITADAIFVRDTADAPERVLIAGEAGKVEFAGFSPEGTHLLFVRTIDGFGFFLSPIP